MKEKLFILTGPTGIGKTGLSIQLARHLNGEIISADSMQIYKYMDIGTAKISISEMEGIKHHLIDFIYPDEGFTVSDYKNYATRIISKINEREKLPILVGGTGLYINSLIYDLKFAQVPPNEELRKQYEDLANKHGNEYIHTKLSKIDKVTSDRISPADRKRIIRALEIYHTTGKTATDYGKNFRKETSKYQLAMICLNMKRSSLYERINKRVDIMVEKGLVREVKCILDKGYDKNLVSMQGIGYKEIIMYLDGIITLEKAIEMIKKGSRNYAKRQLTWFRRDKRTKWVNIDGFNDSKELINYISGYVRSKV